MLCSVADILLASTAGEQHVALVRTHQTAKRCLFNVFQSDYSSKYFQTNIPGSVCQGNFYKYGVVCEDVVIWRLDLHIISSLLLLLRRLLLLPRFIFQFPFAPYHCPERSLHTEGCCAFPGY